MSLRGKAEAISAIAVHGLPRTFQVLAKPKQSRYYRYDEIATGCKNDNPRNDRRKGKLPCTFQLLAMTEKEMLWYA
ncbi:MAG: hypothetical protein ABIK19_05625 [candidate division WOR-3 bacterium]